MSSIQNQSKGMTSTGKQAMILEKALNLLRAKGAIHRFDLMDSLNMTIQKMNHFHPYLEYAWEEIADYNKNTKMWTLKKEAEPQNA